VKPRATRWTQKQLALGLSADSGSDAALGKRPNGPEWSRSLPRHVMVQVSHVLLAVLARAGSAGLESSPVTLHQVKTSARVFGACSI
jgi:hypothetical protein